MRKKRFVGGLIGAVSVVVLLTTGTPASAAPTEVGRYRISDYYGSLLATVTSSPGRVTMQPLGNGYQYWELDPAISTEIVNVNTGDCMSPMVGIPGSDPPLGTDRCFDSPPYQHWQITRWGALYVMIAYSPNPSYCIEVEAGTYELDTELCRYGHPSQLFRLVP